MRKLTIWGAVAVLAVLVATVAVFGSAGLAQAGMCTVPTGIHVHSEDTKTEDTIADNEYHIHWTAPACVPDLYSVTLEICDEDTFKACKTLKFVTALTDIDDVKVDGMKGISSKGAEDRFKVYVRAKHTPGEGKNNDHATGESGGCPVDSCGH